MQKLKTQFDKNTLRPSLATPSCCSCCSCIVSTLTTSVLTSRSLYKAGKKNHDKTTTYSPTKKILYILLGICLWPAFLTLFIGLLILLIWLSEEHGFPKLLSISLLACALIGYGALLYLVKKNLKLNLAWILTGTILPPLFFIIEFFIWMFNLHW